jgi:glycosyltransferase involved in cell wall biosynthesis
MKTELFLTGEPVSRVPTISLVVPVFNEESVLPEFIARAQAALDATGLSWEIVFADDGSSDGTADVVRAYRRHDPRVGLVSLSRNFGKEIAMTAGMDHATGQAVVIIDADLQDPPEVIGDLVAYWRRGYDVVYARRTVREGETVLKRLTAHFFYRVIKLLADRPIPADVGDFRLMSRRAVDALLRLRERRRFMKGLFAWIGFRQIEVPYKRAPRAAGRTKWNYWKLWNFSLEGITGLSIRPLQFATYFGFAIAVAAVFYGIFIILHTVGSGNPVPGYPSLLVTVLFLGGVQLITLGIIGEYIGRISEETKQRPLYLVTQALLGAQPQDQLSEEGALRRGTSRWHGASSVGDVLAVANSRASVVPNQRGIIDPPAVGSAPILRNASRFSPHLVNTVGMDI